MLSVAANSVKKLGATALSATRLHRWLHSRFRRHELTILMYHGVVRGALPVSDACFLDDSTFRQQVEYLRRHFCVLPLSRAVELLSEGAVEKPTVVLTFDDGYQNNFDVAFPVLKEYGLPATIFLATGFVNSSDTIWFCHIIRAVTCTRKQSFRWKDMELDLSEPGRRAVASSRLQAAIKKHPPAEVLSLVRGICEELDVDPLLPFEPESPFRILSASSIQNMRRSGLVEFGAHTETHAILSFLSPEEQRREITSSVEAVRRLTGEACRLFAYPNGTSRDYDAKTIELLRESQIAGAVCTTSGPNDSRTSLMELNRYGTGSNLGMPMFQLQAHHFIAHLRS